MRAGGPCPCPWVHGRMGPTQDPALTASPAPAVPVWGGLPPEVPGEGDQFLFLQPRVLIVVRPAAQSSLMNCNWKEVPL